MTLPYCSHDAFGGVAIGNFFVNLARDRRGSPFAWWRAEVWTVINILDLIAGLDAVLEFALSLDHKESRATSLAGLLLQGDELFDAWVLRAGDCQLFHVRRIVS